MKTSNIFAAFSICALCIFSAKSMAEKNSGKASSSHDQWDDVIPLSDADLNASAERRSQETISDDRTARANKAFAVARYVRKNMNDPSSFELINALVSNDGNVCLRFRGKNSFNAKVIEEFAVTSKGVKGTKDVICGHTSGSMDVTFIKRYL